MYYYIYEPAKSSRDRSFQDKVKKTIVSLGIAGEAVSPNPARTIDELVDIGLSKGYSTIVAIGSDLFANKIVSSILNQQKDENQKIVFGFVSKDPASSTLASLLTCATTEEACQALRYRRVKTLAIGIIKPNKFFLTPLSIKTSSAFRIEMKIPGMEISSQATDLIITPDIQIEWEDETYSLNAFSSFINRLMSRKNPNTSYSYFKADKLELRTEPSLPVHLDSEVIAKSPLGITTLPDYLHVIVNRATLTEVQKGESLT